MTNISINYPKLKPDFTTYFHGTDDAGFALWLATYAKTHSHLILVICDNQAQLHNLESELDFLALRRMVLATMKHWSMRTCRCNKTSSPSVLTY